MDANIRELIVSYSRSLVSIRGSKNPCGARPQGGNLRPYRDPLPLVERIPGRDRYRRRAR
jgi:hypothetical protein